MKNQGKNNLLYFADDELVTGKTEDKKVFVTKRINGKETHVKQEIKKDTEYKRVPNTQGFNFEREIVIGVNSNKKSNINSFNAPKKNKSDISVQNKKNVSDKKKRKNTKKSKKSKESKDSRNIRNFNYGKKIDNSYYENFEKGKKNKSRRNHKALITTISILFMVISIAIMAFLTPMFNIAEIKVEGNNKVTTSNIINLSRIKVGQNIFKNNKGKIEKYIKENSYIDEVEIKRILPSTIEIRVSERVVEYQVQLISSYIYIDKNGNILENAETKEKAIVIEGFSTTEEELVAGKKLNKVDIDKLDRLNKIKDAIKQIDGIELSDVKINIKKDNENIIYLKSENKKIYIGDSSNLSNKMLYIKKILENEKENSGSIFINGDLNDGFKPYFREEEYKE